MRVLERDRGRRYDTAYSLACDVERYLNDEPVGARPVAAMYRLRRFARKHRALLSTVAAFAVVLVFAAGMTAWSMTQAIRRQSRAIQQATAAQEAVRKAAKATGAKAAPGKP